MGEQAKAGDGAEKQGKKEKKDDSAKKEKKDDSAKKEKKDKTDKKDKKEKSDKKEKKGNTEKKDDKENAGNTQPEAAVAPKVIAAAPPAETVPAPKDGTKQKKDKKD